MYHPGAYNAHHHPHTTHSPPKPHAEMQSGGSPARPSSPQPGIVNAETDLIGRAIHFMSGQFAGQIMRAELVEIQKADLGRKYARVDRRPLDPPPVVLLRLYHIVNPGTAQEREQEVAHYDDVEIHGLVCTVDLFPIDGRNLGNGSPRRLEGSPAASPNQTSFSYVPGAQPSFRPTSVFRPNSNLNDIVYHVNNYAVAESSKMTQALVGATFVQPNLVEYQGKKALVFVFADLAVKTEGHFILRYRVFDIFSRPVNRPDDLVMQAECYGGSFRVYSTKEFPGLQASTDLTKHLARWGVRLNIRETERRRRKKGESESVSPPYSTTAMKRKRNSLDSNGGTGDDASGDD